MVDCASKKGHHSSSEEAKRGKGRYHFIQWQYRFESDYNGYCWPALLMSAVTTRCFLEGDYSVACHFLTLFEMILLKISIDLFTVLGKDAISFLSNCQNVRNKPTS